MTRSVAALLLSVAAGLSACRSNPTAAAPDESSAAARWTAQAPEDPESHVAIVASITPRVEGDLSRCTLAVTMTFEPGWHGYAQVSPKGGLHATSLGLRLPAGVELLGSWSRPEGVPSKDDPKNRLYTGVVSFSRGLILPAVPTGAIEVDVDYQVCNESYCLPPTSVPLVLELGDGAGDGDGPEAIIAALVAEHEATELGYVEAYQAYRPRFEAFAAEHRGTEAEVTALLWLMKQSWWLRSDGQMESTAEPIADDLIARHGASPQLAVMPENYYVLSKEKRPQVLAQLLRSPDDGVRAAVHLRQALDGLRSSEPGAAAAVRASCEALQAEFAELPFHESTYGAMADACLGRHPGASLAVGQPAPEITGEDVDGVVFSLSDYRGKVVLLDFWGDW